MVLWQAAALKHEGAAPLTDQAHLIIARFVLPRAASPNIRRRSSKLLFIRDASARSSPTCKAALARASTHLRSQVQCCIRHHLCNFCLPEVTRSLSNLITPAEAYLAPKQHIYVGQNAS